MGGFFTSPTVNTSFPPSPHDLPPPSAPLLIPTSKLRRRIAPPSELCLPKLIEDGGSCISVHHPAASTMYRLRPIHTAPATTLKLILETGQTVFGAPSSRLKGFVAH